MKILIIENTSKDFFASRIKLSKFLYTLGYEVHALIPNIDSKIDLSEYPFIQFHELKIINFRSNLKGFFIFLKKLNSILDKENINIVHAFRLQPNIYACLSTIFRSKKPKIICHVTGLGIIYSVDNFLFRIARFLNTRIYKFCHLMKNVTFIFQNNEDKNYFGFKSRSFMIPGSSANETNFNPSLHTDGIEISKNNLIQNEISFVLVSRLIHEKGITELIEAFRTISLSRRKKNLKLYIIGKEDKTNPRSILLSNYNLPENIVYLGERDDVPKILSRMNVAILPTYYREGTPRFLLEAMYMGKAIITTDVPGCNHLISKELPNGILIKPKSVNEIQKSILASSVKNIELWGRNSAIHYKKYFSEQVIFRQIEKVYVSV